MQLEHTFTVPVGVDEAFAILRDIERIAPCMPGATIEEVDGEEFTGRVKVKVGPMQITYRGKAEFTEVDEAAHRAVIVARGNEARGSGTAQAEITASLVEEDGASTVTVVTDLKVTGKPAQFGRGVMADVGDKLLGQFADCLAKEITAGQPGVEEGAEDVEVPEPAGAATKIAPEDADPSAVAGAVGTAGGRAVTGQPDAGDAVGSPAEPPRSEERPTSDTIDLFDVAGVPVLKRAAPVGGALLLLALIIWLIRRGE